VQNDSINLRITSKHVGGSNAWLLFNHYWEPLGGFYATSDVGGDERVVVAMVDVTRGLPVDRGEEVGSCVGNSDVIGSVAGMIVDEGCELAKMVGVVVGFVGVRGGFVGGTAALMDGARPPDRTKLAEGKFDGCCEVRDLVVCGVRATGERRRGRRRRGALGVLPGFVGALVGDGAVHVAR
jgi:hypothetical protein